MENERVHESRRYNLILLGLIAFFAIISELELAGRLWNTKSHDAFRYVFLLMNLFPVCYAFVFRSRIGRWLDAGEMSHSASAQVEIAILMLAFMFYMAFIFGAELLH
jgi:hypothetical protein